MHRPEGDEASPLAPPAAALPKLAHGKNIWIATVRPDGRPHLVPVWFVWHEARFYLSIDPASVKANNLRHNSRVSLALEDGTNPVICQGNARLLEAAPSEVTAAFRAKYDWAIEEESQYTALVEVVPARWLVW
jgi:nitroimidazol reductase NimA-like FMN-containing flavoprotein (pyridoxamine 5'-phosphate oxidase superfamily)